MGLFNENTGGGIFVNIFQGKMAQKVTRDTPDAKERVNKNGDLVHELHFDTLTGHIEDVYVTHGDYGASWVVKVTDDSFTYLLQLPYSSRYATGILTRLPNVDFAKLVKIKTYYIEGEDGKFRGYATIRQNGGKVSPKFTRENPNGMPEMERITRNGQEIWDSTRQLEFLENMVDKEIRPRIIESNPLAETSEGDSPVTDTVTPRSGNSPRQGKDNDPSVTDTVTPRSGDSPEQKEDDDLPF